MPTYVDRQMPRIQQVVIPVLKAGLPDVVDVGSWVKDVTRREYPLVNVRRLGGLPNQVRPDDLDKAVIELTGYGPNRNDYYEGLAGTENLVLDSMFLLYTAVQKQTVIENVGYLHSYFVTMGPTQFDSPYDDTFRVQALIQLGLRPAHS